MNDDLLWLTFDLGLFELPINATNEFNSSFFPLHILTSLYNLFPS